MEKLIHLENIIIYGDIVITNEQLQYLPALPKLKELEIDKACFTAENLSSLTFLSQLTSLDLIFSKSPGVPIENIDKIMETIASTAPNLEQLQLGGTNLSYNLFRYLNTFKCLRNIFLYEINDTAGLSLKHDIGIIKCPPLETLSLTGVKVGDELIEIFDLSKSPSIRNIHLEETTITDETIDYISEKAPNVNNISLNGCTGITDDACNKLKDFPSLKCLDITETRITQSGISILRDFLPKCKIICGKYTARNAEENPENNGGKKYRDNADWWKNGGKPTSPDSYSTPNNTAYGSGWDDEPSGGHDPSGHGIW